MTHSVKTYRDENVEKVLQRWQLRDELLDDFAEGLKYGVVVDAGQVEAEEAVEKKTKNKKHEGRRAATAVKVHGCDGELNLITHFYQVFPPNCQLGITCCLLSRKQMQQQRLA